MRFRQPNVLVILALVSTASCVWLADLDDLDRGRTDAGSPTSSSSGGAADAGTLGPDAAPDAGRHCTGDAGPVPVPLEPLGFCMDSTEVSNGDFRLFLATNGPTPQDQEPRCAGNLELGPPGGLPAPELDHEPVRAIDFCDAVAYCRWAGKHVCGSRDDQPLNFESRNLASRSQWFAACSHDNDGNHVFPYGTTEVPGRCNDRAASEARDAGSSGSSVPSGSLASCVGGYAGLFDLSGNVIEWEDDCADGGAGLECAMRGGAFYHQGDPLRCDGPDVAGITEQGGGFGIRCCSALE